MTKSLQLEAMKTGESSFDAEAFHAMQERDEQLIHDQVVHGITSKEFVYQFPMNGSPVAGVSVVGARELAYQYGGLKHRIIATLQKVGTTITARSFDPMNITVQQVPEMEFEDDFYEVIIEISDVKKGNAIQIRKRENMMESRKDGSKYKRQHYDVIAESKAFRNGVLNLLPQSVVEKFKQACLAVNGQGQNGHQPQRSISDLRTGVNRYATTNGVPLNKAKINKLGYEEISGLARELNDIDKFKKIAKELDLVEIKNDTTEENDLELE